LVNLIDARFAVLGIILSLTSTSPARADGGTVVPVRSHVDFATFYVGIAMAGGPVEEYLLDTGAGYMTITRQTLAHLKKAGTATYLRKLDGQMADGSVIRVPVYLIDSMTIGDSCQLRDIEAAVLPGSSRGLLGLSALRMLSPFELSTDPPSLRLSNCSSRVLTSQRR
jgi:predicted aspartyl protease